MCLDQVFFGGKGASYPKVTNNRQRSKIALIDEKKVPHFSERLNFGDIFTIYRAFWIIGEALTLNPQELIDMMYWGRSI